MTSSSFYCLPIQGRRVEAGVEAVIDFLEEEKELEEEMEEEMEMREIEKDTGEREKGEK